MVPCHHGALSSISLAQPLAIRYGPPQSRDVLPSSAVPSSVDAAQSHGPYTSGSGDDSDDDSSSNGSDQTNDDSNDMPSLRNDLAAVPLAKSALAAAAEDCGDKGDKQQRTPLLVALLASRLHAGSLSTWQLELGAGAEPINKPQAAAPMSLSPELRRMLAQHALSAIDGGGLPDELTANIGNTVRYPLSFAYLSVKSPKSFREWLSLPHLNLRCPILQN